MDERELSQLYDKVKQLTGRDPDQEQFRRIAGAGLSPVEQTAATFPQLKPRNPDGEITQGSALDFYPTASALYDAIKEMTGIAPSARVMQRVAQAKSPVMRPQSAYEWGDWGAGLAADTIQTGLAGADLAALAPIVGKRAGQSLMNELGQVDVWHGSPHKFDKVSHEKIGTGEGAQAFGWGTYYTDKKEIAKHYSKIPLMKQAMVFDGENLKISEIMNKFSNEIDSNDLVSKYGKNKDTIEALAYRIIGDVETGRVKNPFKPKDIEYKIYEDFSQRLSKPAGGVYRAQLFPGKDPSEYTFLDWYELVPENTLKIIKENSSIFKFAKDANIESKTGEQIYNRLASEIGKKEASLWLKSKGIDGIRYPTETLSGKGAKGGGAYNYVVFDENDVRLVQRESGGQVEDLTKIVETKPKK